mmetsp:Transcript_128935/g.288216  ORF Transcript_128935/g.288216 Transcript_128935/m.288216 type:complete len:247 (+) Transcript_128935:642-1382(+)
MAVKLGDDHAADSDGIRKSLGLIEACLPDVRVHHKDHIVRIDRLLDLLHLLKERGLLLVPAAGIDDDHLVLFCLERLDAIHSYAHRVRLSITAVKRNTHFGRILLQLVESASPESVCTDQCHLPTLPLVVDGVLGTACRLPRTLQPNKHHHTTLALLRLEGLPVRRHELRELVTDTTLDEPSPVGARCQRFFQLQLVPDAAAELRDVANIHISFEQCLCNLLKTLVDGLFIDDGSGVELLQRSGEL